MPQSKSAWAKFPYIFTILLLIAAGSTAIVIYNSNPNEQPEMASEIFKSSLQVITVGVLGAIITEAYKRLQDKRDRDETYAQVSVTACKDYMERLGRAYRSAKAERRLVKTIGFGKVDRVVDQASPEFAVYKAAMQRLNQTQLELEALKIEAGARPEFARIEGLTDNLRSMEEYLRKILEEYEDYCEELQPTLRTQVTQLLRLNGFIRGDDRAEIDFFTPYESSINSISKYLFSSVR